jgi:cytochrome c553
LIEIIISAMVWKNSNNTMKAAASFFVKLLLGFAASSAVASAFVTVVPPKIITTHQTHHQPESSTKLAAQNQSHFHQLSSWLSSPTIAAAPIISAATIFALTVVTSYPSPATAAGDVTKGSQIFTSTCAGCHAGGNNFIKENGIFQKELCSSEPSRGRENVRRGCCGCYFLCYHTGC